MEKYLTYAEIYDYTAESYGINASIGGFIKRIIDENKYGQCVLDVAKVLEDMNVMMHRYSTDGDPFIACRPISYEPVKTIMEHHLNKRVEYIRQLDSTRAN